jgi:zinc D-Ala-D-Ala dipeptidase
MNDQNKNEAARRAYWIEQAELAYDFMTKMHEYPVTECGEPMQSLRQAVKDARLTVKFSDTKIAEKYDRVFYLREGLIKKILAVAKEMNDRGCFLQIEDCFRSRAMQRDIGLQKHIFDFILKKVIWENNGKIPSPELMLRRFTAFIATAPKIGTHLSGSAIDISVYQASNLGEMDRGGPYLEMSELTFMESPFISEAATENRLTIQKTMRKHGFVAYPYEFWHFSQGDAYSEYLTESGSAARYGAISFDLSSGKVTPIESTEKPFLSIDKIKENIEAALDRLK